MAPRQVLRFGDFTLDPQRLELYREADPVRIAPQPLRALAYLADRAGQLVTREELRAHIWQGTIVEYDQGINFCIRRIRKALHDDARAPRFLETVPRRGYRFVAAVTVDQAALPTRVRRVRRMDGRRWGWLAAGIAATAASIGGLAVTRLVGTDGRVSDRVSSARVAYQRGEYLLSRGTPDALHRSYRHFENAIGYDSSYAPAYAAMADAYYFTPAPDDSVMPLARAAAERALRIDPRAARARLRVGDIQLYFDRDWEGARASYLDALASDPTLVGAVTALGTLHVLRGDSAEGVRYAERAARMDPVSPDVQHDLGWIYYFAGDYPTAIEYCRYALELEPKDVGPLTCVLDAEIELGRHNDAMRVARSYLQATGSVPAWAETLDEPGEWLSRFHRWRLEALERQARERYVSPAWFALLYARLNDVDRSRQWREIAERERARQYLFLVREPSFRRTMTERG